MVLFSKIIEKRSIKNIPSAIHLVQLFLNTEKKPFPGVSDEAKKYLTEGGKIAKSKNYLKLLPLDKRQHIAQNTGLDLTLKNKNYKTTLRLAREAQAALTDEAQRKAFQPIIDLLDEATQKNLSQSTTHD